MTARGWQWVALLLAAGCTSQPPKQDPQQQAEGLYLAGTAAFLQGQLDQALKAFEQVKALQPNDVRLHAAVGEVYLAQRRLPDALKEFQAASVQDPRRATNWSRIGYILSVLGRHDEARSALNKAVGLNPSDFNALEELGELDVKEGQVDAAVGHFVLAAQASPDPGKADLYVRAGEVLAQRGRLADAAKLLGRASGAGVKSTGLLVDLGDDRVKLGDLPGAADAYREAARVTPADPTLWELVGEIEAKLGRPADAEEAYRESLRVKDRALVHVALARLDLSRKDRASASRELDLALGSAAGDDPRETKELAELLVSFDRKTDALKLLDNLAAEPGAERDADLQLRTARLAKALGQNVTANAACARLRADGGTVRCP